MGAGSGGDGRGRGEGGREGAGGQGVGQAREGGGRAALCGEGKEHRDGRVWGRGQGRDGVKDPMGGGERAGAGVGEGRAWQGGVGVGGWCWTGECRGHRGGCRGVAVGVEGPAGAGRGLGWVGGSQGVSILQPAVTLLPRPAGDQAS